MLMCIQNSGRFFPFVLKIMSGNEILTSIKGRNKKLSMLMCIQNLVRFCQFILKTFSGNQILTSNKGRNSVKIWRKMTGNNPKLDLVNVDVHTNFGQILSIHSHDIEQKQNSDINQGP